MTREEFVDAIMEAATRKDDTDDDANKALLSLTDFYDSTEKAHNEAMEQIKAERARSSKLALRMTDDMKKGPVKTDEEIEQERLDDIDKRVSESIKNNKD